MTTRRTTFNLNDFLGDLRYALTERTDLIDDEVQRYKDFLGRTKEPLKSKVIKYVNNHTLVTDNKELRSYIVACHTSNFVK